MSAAPLWVVRVQFERGRRRFYGPNGKEIAPDTAARWMEKGWLEPLEPGLFDEPQSYAYIGRPPARWLAAV